MIQGKRKRRRHEVGEISGKENIGASEGLMKE